MVVYNELVAVTAGAGLLGFAWFLTPAHPRQAHRQRGLGGFFGVTGLLLLALGLHTTVTWPFGGDGFEYANIAFGQPAAGFGALLLFAAVYLWRHRSLFAGDAEAANATALAALKPVGIFVGALGLAMARPGHHVRPLPARRRSAGGAHQRPVRPPAHPRGAVPRWPVGHRRHRRAALRRSPC